MRSWMTDPGRTDNRSRPGPAVPVVSPGSDPHAGVWAPRLARLLDHQRGLYEELAALAREQSRCIDADETDGLLEVLGKRQRVIEEISRTNQEVSPFTQAWDRLAPSLSESDRRELRARFDAVGALVEKIAAGDEADRKRLEARRVKVGQEIEGLSAARGALKAYARPAATSPMFQDSRG